MSVKNINRELCKEFCDRSGIDGEYRKDFIYAATIDIVFFIGIFAFGLSAGITELILGGFAPLLVGLLRGTVGFIVFLIVCAFLSVVFYLLFVEIGFFLFIPIFARIFLIFMAFFPMIGSFISLIIGIIPWSLIAVILHMAFYDRFGWI